MFTYEIEYEDFNDNKQKESFNFHLSKRELIELEAVHQGGLGNMMEEIVRTNDQKEIVYWFQEIVLMAYGVKSEDGKHFDKSDEVKKLFKSSAAYNAIWEELATSEIKAEKFLKELLPKDLVAEATLQQAKSGTLELNELRRMDPPKPPISPNT